MKKKTHGAKTFGELMERSDAERARFEEAAAMRRAADARLWRRRYEEVRQEKEQLEAERAMVLGLDMLPREEVLIEAPERKANGESAAILVCSDWHVYETVKPAEVNGLNRYDVETAARSIETLFQTALRLVEIERAGTRIQTFVLALLGDLMTSQLHEDQLECNAGTPQEEMLFLLERISGGLRFLLADGKFDRVVVPCCDGNHGRATEKLRVAGRTRHSNEWLLYRLLAREFAREERVVFQIADGYHLYMKIYGRTVRWHHGDGVRYQGGVGGLTIPVRKAIAEWNKGRKADLDVFGHWHTSHMDRDFVSNGSVLGYSPFAVRIKAPFEAPTQTLLIVESKRWITSYRPLYVR